MNTKLIFLLSVFGFLMAIATVNWIPSGVEPFFWLVIFIVVAYLIAKNCSGKYFLHGLLVGLVNCVWVTAGHIIFINMYLSNHPRQAAMMERTMPDHPRIMMLITGLLIGVISGIILGLFAVIASKLTKKKEPELQE